MPRAAIPIVFMLLFLRVCADASDKKPVTFQTVAMGEIEDTAATKAGFRTKLWSFAHFGFTTFKASVGNTLTVFYDDFNKAEEAKRFLNWKLSKAFEVLSQTTKTDPNGRPAEYHVELVPEAQRSDVEVMWVVGTAVHWIRARTLEDARELERQYRN
jgi:hypothetical protein